MMWRTILGLLAASTAAPYAMIFIMLALEPIFQIDLLTIELTTPADILKFILLGSLLVVSLGPVIVLLAILIILGLNALSWRSPWIMIASGSLLGSCIVGLMFLGLVLAPTPLLKEYDCYVFASALAGAICGWIYWRIAIKQTSGTPRAIDPA